MLLMCSLCLSHYADSLESCTRDARLGRRCSWRNLRGNAECVQPLPRMVIRAVGYNSSRCHWLWHVAEALAFAILPAEFERWVAVLMHFVRRFWDPWIDWVPKIIKNFNNWNLADASHINFLDFLTLESIIFVSELKVFNKARFQQDLVLEVIKHFSKSHLLNLSNCRAEQLDVALAYWFSMLR